MPELTRKPPETGESEGSFSVSQEWFIQRDPPEDTCVLDIWPAGSPQHVVQTHWIKATSWVLPAEYQPVPCCHTACRIPSASTVEVSGLGMFYNHLIRHKHLASSTASSLGASKLGSQCHIKSQEALAERRRPDGRTQEASHVLSQESSENKYQWTFC